MIEPGKFYTNNLGNNFKCLEVSGNKVKLWAYIEVSADKNFFALKKDGSKELVRNMSMIITQDIKYSYQYKIIENQEEINRLSKLYDEELDGKSKRPGLKRSEAWRLEYHKRRYLEYVSLEELAQRLRDIISNVVILKEDGRTGLVSIAKGGGYWLSQFSHIQEEYNLRRLDYPDGVLKDAKVPKPTYPDIPRSVAAVEGRIFSGEVFLIKYGKACHIKSMYENGEIQIKPASMYNDPSLNHAIKDNELSKTIYSLPSEVRMEAFDHKTGESRGKLNPIGNIANTSNSNTDYYLCCLSCVYDHRLFGDFNYDSCLIIKKPMAFVELLNRAFKERYPTWSMLNGNIIYVDPLNVTNPYDNNPFLTKHFRYTYQHEFRLIWLPPPGQRMDSLSPMNLNIGSLKDIADFITI